MKTLIFLEKKNNKKTKNGQSQTSAPTKLSRIVEILNLGQYVQANYKKNMPKTRDSCPKAKLTHA
jgi:hypothetical protein